MPSHAPTLAVPTLAVPTLAVPTLPAIDDGADPGSPWLDLALATAALVFETDGEGAFTFVGPDPMLGWRADALLGQPGAALLAQPAGAGDPFRPAVPLHHQRCWLRRGDGSVVCLVITALPVLDGAGRIAGARGCGIEWSALDATEPEVATAVRRAEVLDHLLRSLRIERLPERMTQQALRTLTGLIGADGALVVDAAAVPAQAILHAFGAVAEAVATAACDHLRDSLDGTPAAALVDGQPILVCPVPTRFGGQSGLVLWRRAERRRWETADLAIAGSAAGLVRLMLEHGFVQAGLAAQARTDSVTGLANRRAFFNEVPRRIDRLDRDRLPGTMMLIALDQFDRLTRQFGPDLGDEALRIAAALLRVTFRPGDVIARLRGAAFTVWMDGADMMTAAERAEALCRDGPDQFAHLGRDGIAITLAIGIAMRWPDGTEDATELKHRAELAADLARKTGAPGWQAWQAEE